MRKKKLQVDGGIRYCTLVLREGALVVTGMAVLLLADDLVESGECCMKNMPATVQQVVCVSDQ